MHDVRAQVETWFAERYGAPTPAQERAWPAIRAGGDVLLAAPTGSGKTLAAFLHALTGLFERAAAGTLEKGTRVVYVSPLRALSNDVRKNLLEPLAALSARLGLPAGAVRVAVRTGDTSAKDRAAFAESPAHVLVTTPESLYLLLTTTRGRAALATTELMIVDEIHALAPDRRGAHLALSLERLDALVGGARRPQRVGLSATQKPIDAVATYLTGGGPSTIIDLGHARKLDLDVIAPEGELSAVATHEQWKDVHDQLAVLVGEHRSTLVFTNTRKLSERVAQALSERLGEDVVGAHHGAMARESRELVETRLKEGALRVVVATSSLELGIDVGAVELVVQIDSPRTIAAFVQRIGRARHSPNAGPPKGRLVATTRDGLVECTALVRAAHAGLLDAIHVPVAPLDVLAQQIVAAASVEDFELDALFTLVTRAAPYHTLTRARFDQVIEMLSEGYATRRGRAGAYLHLDRVGARVKARRAARLAAILSGGAIPERADYDVVVDPEGTKVGTLDEDFAIESMAGDVFLLGNTSWRVTRVEAGKVRVLDAKGMPPTIPFWLGEGPSRTRELSAEVARLRAELEAKLRTGDEPAARAWLSAETGLADRLAAQIVAYVAAMVHTLGHVPTQDTLIVERFFDEAGGMQVVLHAPFGARINRAWGLALRKKFCRSFDFELQAAATDDGVLLSVGEQHSFPLETIYAFVRSHAARETLLQAVLQAPVFGTRWRWTATRALAVLRRSGGKKVPPHLQRMRSDDLLAAVFPAQAGCQDNNPGGEVEPPDHPLVVQAVGDCLDEFLDTDGLIQVLRRLEAGELTLIARDLPEPSPAAAALLAANPYAFLDDAPLEERRTRAVSVRRSLAGPMRELGALDVAAIDEVRRDAWPRWRDADEMHDALLVLAALPATLVTPDAAVMIDVLAAARRATLATTPGGRALWIAAERVAVAQAAWPGVVIDPHVVVPRGAPVPEDREQAVTILVRGTMEHVGPTTAAEVAVRLDLSVEDVDGALVRLEADGAVLRGSFTPGADPLVLEWCDRRLLQRIHRLTLGRLRREIEPVTLATYGSFVARWQKLAPGTQLHGVDGLAHVIAMLEGVEAPLAAWEQTILPARVADYRPELLDELCLAGEVMWGRLSRSEAARTTRVTPIALWRRTSAPWILGAMPPLPPADPEADPRVAPAADAVLAALARRGALFYAELETETGLPRQLLDAALWELVARAAITADGFAALRTLAAASPRRVGRWARLITEAPSPAVLAEAHAQKLLDRWGVVWRELARRELGPPWSDVLGALRRMEARGTIRGGRFVDGVGGEQFARADAVDALRLARREEAPLAPSDPLLLRVVPLVVAPAPSPAPLESHAP